jgi:hypothetical protein
METNLNEVSINGVEYVRKDGVKDVEELSEEYVIVRTYSAGVFAGHLLKRVGQEVTLKDARRIWYWDGAASLSQLAMEGTSKPQNCKFPCPVSEILLTQAIEVIPCTKKAEKSIKGVTEWKQ